MRIPVTIVTGFLGAGKTTLLNRFMSEPGFGDTAVIINEFGEAGVDGGLVAKSDDRAFAMSTGCLCCTVMGDVRITLLRLLREAEEGTGPKFSRVVIETTGLADPMPVLQTFMSNDMILSRFALNGVVTLVDAINGQDAIERFPEAERQAAVADLMVVTKGDLAVDPVSKKELGVLTSTLANLNPNARVMQADEVTAEIVFSLAAFDPAGKSPDVRDWLAFRSDDHGHDHHHDHHDHGDHHHDHGHHHHHDLNAHGNTASAFCFSASAPVSAPALEKALLALQSFYGRDLLRVKGLVELAERPGNPRVLHAVGHITSPPKLLEDWPDGIDETRIVVIVAGPSREDAPKLLQHHVPEICSFRTEFVAA